MRAKEFSNKWAWIAFAIIALVHFALLHLVAGRNIISVILGQGKNAPTWLLLCVAVFVFVRLFAILAMPGLILYLITRKMLRRKSS
jgi:hypothetical protein